MTGAPPTRQNIQPQISRGTPPRENGRSGLRPEQPITWPFLAKEGLNSDEVNRDTNRMRRQALLDRQKPALGVALPRAVRGRSHGASMGASELQKCLEGVAPPGPDSVPAGFPQDNAPAASFSLKSRAGKGALMTGAGRHLRLVPPPSPPRPRRLEIRISVADARGPYGRTRIFRLSEHDFEQLIVTAERFEAR
jgi:hypothetical protein